MLAEEVQQSIANGWVKPVVVAQPALPPLFGPKPVTAKDDVVHATGSNPKEHPDFANVATVETTRETASRVPHPPMQPRVARSSDSESNRSDSHSSQRLLSERTTGSDPRLEIRPSEHMEDMLLSIIEHSSRNLFDPTNPNASLQPPGFLPGSTDPEAETNPRRSLSSNSSTSEPSVSSTNDGFGRSDTARSPRISRIKIHTGARSPRNAEVVIPVSPVEDANRVAHPRSLQPLARIDSRTRVGQPVAVGAMQAASNFARQASKSKFEDGSLVNSIRRGSGSMAPLNALKRDHAQHKSQRALLVEQASKHALSSPRNDRRISFADEAGKQLSTVYYYRPANAKHMHPVLERVWNFVRTQWMYVGPLLVIAVVIAVVLAIAL